MSYKKVVGADLKFVGQKQTLKALRSGKASEKIIADDADDHVTQALLDAAKQEKDRIVSVPSKLAHGKASGIDGAATAGACK
ncbi:MAG TPA: 50S ribosomal protein L7ae-like protein, partial [Exiguobacterium sp.]|nr:50S ribosomal protein L7ae-like protein [Exiguobacterium sp.]